MLREFMPNAIIFINFELYNLYLLSVRVKSTQTQTVAQSISYSFFGLFCSLLFTLFSQFIEVCTPFTFVLHNAENKRNGETNGSQHKTLHKIATIVKAVCELHCDQMKWNRVCEKNVVFVSCGSRV